MESRAIGCQLCDREAPHLKLIASLSISAKVCVKRFGRLWLWIGIGVAQVVNYDDKLVNSVISQHMKAGCAFATLFQRNPSYLGL